MYQNNISFWNAWRKRFCSKNLKSSSVVNGVSGKENILKEFSRHLSQVSQPNTHNADQKYERKASQAASTDHGTVRFIDIHLMHE